MKASSFNKLAIVVISAALTGCASYQVSSNVPDSPTAGAISTKKPIVLEDSMPGKKHKEIGPVEVSIKKLTMFHKDPTREMANEALAEKAQTIVGADAVINTKYKTGIGFTTWGYIDASGTAVKIEE